METSRTELPSLKDPTAVKLSRLFQRYSGLDDLKEIQKVFESGVDVNVILDEDFNRPLHLACNGFNNPDHVRHDLVRYLIEKGADLNVRNREQTSKSCFYSVCSTWSFDLIKSAVEHGANDKCQDDSVLLALTGSDFEYNGEDIEEIVKFLVKHGANVNSYDDYNTPLIYASDSGNVKLMAALLPIGADVNHMGYYGDRALSEYLVSNYKNDNFFEGVKLLVEAGVDLNAQAYLTQACSTGANLKVIQYLIDSGARVNNIDSSSFYYTSRNGNQYKIAPIHQACYKGNLDLIKLLVENGANVNTYAIDKNNTLPLMITKELNLKEASEYLIKMGANATPKPPDSIFMSCFKKIFY